MLRAAIFDLDGTLVDSLPGIAAALNRALARHGLPVQPEERVRGFVGNGSRMLVRRGIGGEPPEELIDLVHREFFPAYAETWQRGTHLYPGIKPLLLELQRGQVPLAVFSNKPHRFTIEIVKDLLPHVSWRAILGQQDSLPRKPDPAGAHQIARAFGEPPSTVAFVGDSLVDFETARAAGMQPVLVSWGFRPGEELAATGAPVMHSPADLQKYLRTPRRDG